MMRFILRRVAQFPLIIVAVYTLTFALAWLIPGNPLEHAEGRRPPAEIAAAMEQQYKLDDPVAFYFDYLGKATGVSWLLGLHDRPFDLGPSLRHENWSVNEILAAGLPVSMTVGLGAMVLACVLGLGAGVLGGTKPRTFRDASTMGIALIGISLPGFVVGTVLLVGLAVWLPLFPIGGWGTPRHLVLPCLTLALPYAAYIARLTRTGMIEQMSSEHIRFARAKGLSEARVVLRHALPNAFLPVLSYLGPATAMAMTGSFVVEKVFAVPGVGTHFVNAVLAKDITLIMGVVLTYALMLMTFNLVVDVMYRFVDPRMR